MDAQRIALRLTAAFIGNPACMSLVRTLSGVPIGTEIGIHDLLNVVNDLTFNLTEDNFHELDEEPDYEDLGPSDDNPEQDV